MPRTQALRNLASSCPELKHLKSCFAFNWKHTLCFVTCTLIVIMAAFLKESLDETLTSSPYNRRHSMHSPSTSKRLPHSASPPSTNLMHSGGTVSRSRPKGQLLSPSSSSTRLRSHSSQSSQSPHSGSGNHCRFSVSVMGATKKQRTIYMNTWIDTKRTRGSAVKTEYGQMFHVKQWSAKISLDLYVHEIEHTSRLEAIWNQVTLNVLVLPFDHHNQLVDKPLKSLIHSLASTKIALRALFSKTLLICPSNFSSLTEDDYLVQTANGKTDDITTSYISPSDHFLPFCHFVSALNKVNL